MNDLNEFSGIIRRGIDDYGMINENDALAVGVSGGKDSLILLLAMKHLQSYYPKSFYLEAVTVDLGFEGMDFAPVSKLCEDIGVPYTSIKTDIKEIVFDVRRKRTPARCARKCAREPSTT